MNAADIGKSRHAPPLTALIGFNYGMLDDYGSICKAITGLVDINNL